MITVTKVFKTDASHILPDHHGKCQNLHGHTYTYEITVARGYGNDALDYKGPARGMVVDFGDLTDYWKKELEPKLDHVHLNDSLGIYPTAEMIALWVGKQVDVFCRNRSLVLMRVNVHEGPGAFASYIPEVV
jgi:6-pyruvoyltetrahydropterin/6-carboxytetrahydropterin synthase